MGEGPANAESFDLLVRWPGDPSLADLDRRKTFAVAAYPRCWDLRRRTVWVAHDGEVVRRLSMGEVSNVVSNLPIAGAAPSSHGHRLKIRSGGPVKSMHLMDVEGAN